MTDEEYKEWGRRFLDWTADYLGHPERHAVLSGVRPGEVRRQLPDLPPMQPESFEAVLRDLDRIILPGLTHWNHPSFFAYFANTGSEPGIFGELLTAALNVNGMVWRTSPAATELEQCVLDWLRGMMGLPADFEGMILDTASTSTFHALAAARETLKDWDVRENGIGGPDAPRLRIYASEQAHSSVEKSAMALGMGRRGFRKVAADAGFQMDVAALEEAVAQDLQDGLRPIAVVATVGTTSTTSIDPVPRIADVCEKYGIWLHVDAAYAGSAAILPEMRYILEGSERADSFVVNPHKWLLTPMDLSVFYFRHPEMLRKAFSLSREYLKTPEGDSVTNQMDYSIQLGRRFRALKLWMVIRHYGVEGLQAILREHIRLARMFASFVESDPRFEIAAPVLFSTVCFRLKSGDSDNQELMDRVNATGRLFISNTILNGRLTLRFAIGNGRTAESHVRAAWDEIRR
jgi:aromatic-L-amino-acid decarboxylase